MSDIKETSRIARLAAPFGNEVGGIINFLDEIKLWEISEGEIPTQFYTFNTMLKVYTLAFKFVAAVALIGNLFDIIGYFLGVKLTPVWYAVVFFFLYHRYYGTFGSFGLTVYRTVVVITVITLFLVDNGFKLLVEVGVKKLLLLSDFPEIASYIPPYSPDFYHFVYLVTFFLPKKNLEERKTKKLYSDEIVEISAEEYSRLVEGVEENYKKLDTPVTLQFPKKKHKLSSNKEIKKETMLETEKQNSFSNSDSNSASSSTRNDLIEKIRKTIEGKIDEDFDVFIWDKKLYVLRSLIPETFEEGLKVKISKNGKVLREGIYLRFNANEILDKETFKKLMRERFKNPKKRELFKGLQVEVLGRA